MALDALEFIVTGPPEGNLKGIGCFRRFSGSPLIVGAGSRGIQVSRTGENQDPRPARKEYP